MSLSWTDDEPLEGEADVTRRDLDNMEWQEQERFWEQEDRDRKEAHE